jgi:hypothetical protein
LLGHEVKDSVLRYGVIFLEFSNLEDEGTVFLPDMGTDYPVIGHCVPEEYNDSLHLFCISLHMLRNIVRKVGIMSPPRISFLFIL